jgi:hypothetical protein
MFLENKAHLQQDLFGMETLLCESKRKKLRSSSDAFFYTLVYCSSQLQNSFLSGF